jgi:hypothetical protein
MGWSSGGPRIVSILWDPVQLLMEDQLWVTAQDKLLMEGYPVNPS